MKNLFTILFVTAIFFNSYPQDTINVPGDYTTIQAAIDASNNGDIILVAEDTYYENINFKGKAITVTSWFLVDGDTSHISNTVINGSQPSHHDSGSVVYFISGEDTTSILCGFTITEGGCGIQCDNSGMKIINNKITTNHNYLGGGISIEAESNQCNIIIEKNTISNNISQGGRDEPGRGGGIFIARTSGSINVRISNNFISYNLAFPSAGGYSDGLGGGIHIRNCSPLISNNIIAGNIEGGGVYLYESNSLLQNNLIISNKAGGVGGVYIENAQPIFINNTIANNDNTFGNSSVFIERNSNPIFVNCILWNDTTEISLNDSCSVTISHSDIKGGLSGIILGVEDTVYWLDGNIDVYPEFVDTANGDFHLTDNSACIGAAIDSLDIGGTWYYCPLTDLEGHPRPNPSGTMPDMGAYENGPMVGVEEDILSINPGSFSLSQNFPNPFNPVTTIKFAVPNESNANLSIYNVLGELVSTLVNEQKKPGYYEYKFDASTLASGVYLYRFKAGDFVETKKMVLLK